MRHKNWVTSLKLEQWADSLSARALLPQLLRRLVHATLESSAIKRAQFPSGEGVQRPDEDGLTETSAGNAKVPVGAAAWESGCDKGIKGKADFDFSKRLPDAQKTFIFVTPRKWTRKQDWCYEKRKPGSWREVRVYDSADLEQWLELAPAVDIWLAHEIGLKPTGVCDLATHWKNLAASLRLPLAPSFVLTDRKEAATKFRDWLRGPASTLAVEAPSPAEVLDFVAGWAANLDAPEQAAVAARAIIVEEREAWRALAASNTGLVLIAGPQLELEAELVAEAVRQNHHVAVFASRHRKHQGNALTLRRMFQSNLHDALRAAGANAVDAQRIAREAGGSFTILKRLLSRNPALTTPRWCLGTEASALAPLLLAGAWDDNNPADKAILERLSGRPYAELLALANRLRVEPDAAVMRVGTGWMFVSRADSWRLLQWALTSDLLGRFEAIAIEVLAEANPAFELPADERYLASVRGKTLKNSGALREGLAETLGLMGIVDAAAEVGDACEPHIHAARVVRSLLDGADWLRWASLSGHLPDFAEAAPDEFLQAVESDLRRQAPELFKLFGQEGDGIFGGSPHTGLLWALEVLAWEPKFLGRAALTLARLASFDPGGRLCNRPANSLCDIFLSWFPHTNASVAERLTVLARLLKQEPSVAWKLLLGLLPKQHGFTSGTYKPKWQHWLDQWKEGVTRKDYRDFVVGVAELLVTNAVGDIERWEGLAEHLDELPEPALDRVLAGVRELAGRAAPGFEITRLWSLVRAEASKHRYAQGLEWALPESIVQKLEATAACLAPADPVARNSWLFDSGVAFHVGQHGQKYEETEKLLLERRIVALREIWEAAGIDGILQVARRASMPWEVGVASGKAQLPMDVSTVLPPFLVSEETPVRQFARGCFDSCHDSGGWSWLESMRLETWPVNQAVALLTFIPFQPKLWDFVASLGTAVEDGYWKQTYTHAARLTEDQVMFVVAKLRACRRPFSALDFVDGARHGGMKFSEEFLLSVLEGAVVGTEPPDEKPGDLQMLQYHITELFQCLQQSPKTDETRLTRLEWACLKLLDGFQYSPVALHRLLSRDPHFFAEVMTHLYRAKSERGKPKEEASAATQNLAEGAYSLMKIWHRIPGRADDGTIDKTALVDWLIKAREECSKLDRLEVADLEIGEILACAPADADGTWPCLAVRDAMEDLNSEEIFRGFDMGVMNSRGVTTRSLTEGGAQERSQMAKFQGFADRIRAGWPLVAATLQRIADSYAHQAKWEDERTHER
ncbi:MAG: hypothetical protein HYY24_10745 [Verrucomicrobia bacterium]|nr:hypothetical protein [Verrucomicrobiota bacterium]